MTGETRKRKWGICFDPRTKVLLLIISMIIATTAPSLSYECALNFADCGYGDTLRES